MNNYFKNSSLALIAASAMLIGCSQEEVSQTEDFGRKALNINVVSQDFISEDGSRAVTGVDENRTSTFSNDDEIGLFVIGSDGNAIYDNVKFVYDGSKWTAESSSELYYWKNADYILYYPYDTTLTGQGITTSNEIKDIFSNKEGFYNQATADAYESADLMMAEVSDAESENLTFNIEHQFSMIEISVPVRRYKTKKPYGESNEIFEYTAPVKLVWSTSLKYGDKEVTPYSVGKGVYRFIVQPGENIAVNIDGYVQYEDTPYNFSNSNAILSLTQGNFKHYKVTVEGISDEVEERDIEVGDYYYSDGSIYPYGNQDNNDLDNPMKEGCIGVIFEVGSTLQISDSKTKNVHSGIENTKWNHASVLALEAAGSEQWSTAKKTIENNIYADFTGNLPFVFDGYERTYQYQALGLDTDDALLKVTSFGGTQYMAPASSSGWYMPSVGQLVLILNNLGGGTYKDFMVNPTDKNQGNRFALMAEVQRKLQIVNESANVYGMWLLANEKDANNSWAYEPSSNYSANYFLGRPKARAYRYWAVLSF